MIASCSEALQYDAVPEVIFTRPQIAGVGLAEKEAAVEGIKLGSVVFDKDVNKLSCCAG